MARNRDNTPADTAAETQTPTPDVAANPAPAATAANGVADPATTAIDERFKTVKHPGTGATVKRQDYIRDLWRGGKMTRGQIAKHITELSGKKVPYQIVFAATKKMAGGPPKEATPPVTTTTETPVTG